MDKQGPDLGECHITTLQIPPRKLLITCARHRLGSGSADAPEITLPFPALPLSDERHSDRHAEQRD